MKRNEMVRQGDLLIVKISKPEGELKKLAHRVLADGEITGHQHKLTLGVLYKKNDWDSSLFFDIPKGQVSELEHPEHKTQVFPSGFYEVIRQREYTERGIREIRD